MATAAGQVGGVKEKLDLQREPSSNGLDHAGNDNPSGELAAAVRFKSEIEEISPEQTVSSEAPASQQYAGLQNPGEVTPALLRELSRSLHGSHLQELRMNTFSFEPFSLPPSRTPSHEEDPQDPSRQRTRSTASHNSPLLGPGGADMASPPLTPAASGATEGESKGPDQPAEHEAPTRGIRGPEIITPQDSSHEIPSPGGLRKLAHRSVSSEDVSARPPSAEEPSPVLAHHRKEMFSLGAAGGSLPVSREASPSRAAAASQFYTRPFTPVGDSNDPYAASKRQPQNKIESRFVFSRNKKKTSPSSSSTSLPRPSQDKRPSSGLLGHLNKNQHGGGDVQNDGTSTPMLRSRQNSMSDLKRFFKLGAHHKMKRAASPAASVRSGAKTPPSSRSSPQIPFGDDHGLTSKYGKLGKVLGSGAGGSVRLMKRSEDGVVFAVKEFRARHSYETEREYVKKLTAEYCIGSSLHHGNIIETLDIVQEKGKWYDVMEYAPYDLFAIVMTGRQSREEVACCFLQILSGVTYLHSMGLAHRDLKLDNVVVNDRGIMKIIDFGSAHVFRYPFENGVVLAQGIVGSDPYLAPEVYEERRYEPQGVDIWSLAIIFCCMSLRRFPWKVPRLTDSSFKLFAADPTPGHDPKKLVLPPSKSTTELSKTPARDTESMASDPHRPSRSEQASVSSQTGDGAEQKKEVIRGPWRILRLLPRESRHVIGRMLEIDPHQRAKMEEILDDAWVANTVICRETGPGMVINASDHTHILEPSSGVGGSSGK